MSKSEWGKGYPEISIIIPCFNIREELALNLASFAIQDYPPSRFELVVINDGSTDGTDKFLKNSGLQLNIKGINLERRADRTIARNSGLEQAEGEIIIFCDGDTICYPQFLEKHAELHNQYTDAVVSGMSTAHAIFTMARPDYDRNTNRKYRDFLDRHTTLRQRVPKRLKGKKPLFSVSEVLDKSIYQYVFSDTYSKNLKRVIREYGLGLEKCPVPWIFFITRNCSVRKASLGRMKFDQELSRWGMDDWQLGYRLYRKGFKFMCTKPTNIHQVHPRNLKARRQNRIINYAIFSRQYPEVDVYLSGIKKKGWDYLRLCKVVEEFLAAKASRDWNLQLYARYFARLAKEQRDLIIGKYKGYSMSDWEHQRYQWGRVKYSQLVKVDKQLNANNKYPYLIRTFREFARIKRVKK
jgi:glycosyltransferase involved in cell wall biosynthesis